MLKEGKINSTISASRGMGKISFLREMNTGMVYRVV
jgi:hypothetical protein